MLPVRSIADLTALCERLETVRKRVRRLRRYHSAWVQLLITWMRSTCVFVDGDGALVIVPEPISSRVFLSIYI